MCSATLIELQNGASAGEHLILPVGDSNITSSTLSNYNNIDNTPKYTDIHLFLCRS